MTNWLSPNPFNSYDVTVYFDDSRLDQDDVEKALDPRGRHHRVGSGTDFTTGERDVQYSYATKRGADNAAKRVKALAKSRRVKVRVEITKT